MKFCSASQRKDISLFHGDGIAYDPNKHRSHNPRLVYLFLLYHLIRENVQGVCLVAYQLSERLRALI